MFNFVVKAMVVILVLVIASWKHLRKRRKVTLIIKFINCSSLEVIITKKKEKSLLFLKIIRKGSKHFLTIIDQN